MKGEPFMDKDILHIAATAIIGILILIFITELSLTSTEYQIGASEQSSGGITGNAAAPFSRLSSSSPFLARYNAMTRNRATQFPDGIDDSKDPISETPKKKAITSVGKSLFPNGMSCSDNNDCQSSYCSGRICMNKPISVKPNIISRIFSGMIKRPADEQELTLKKTDVKSAVKNKARQDAIIEEHSITYTNECRNAIKHPVGSKCTDDCDCDTMTCAIYYDETGTCMIENYCKSSLLPCQDSNECCSRFCKFINGIGRCDPDDDAVSKKRLTERCYSDDECLSGYCGLFPDPFSGVMPDFKTCTVDPKAKPGCITEGETLPKGYSSPVNPCCDKPEKLNPVMAYDSMFEKPVALGRLICEACPNRECDRYAGENALNCPADCDCISEGFEGEGSGKCCGGLVKIKSMRYITDRGGWVEDTNRFHCTKCGLDNYCGGGENAGNCFDDCCKKEGEFGSIGDECCPDLQKIYTDATARYQCQSKTIKI